MLIVQFQIDTLSFWEYSRATGSAEIVCTYKRKETNDLTQAFSSFSKIFSECRYNSSEDILVVVPQGPVNYPSLCFLNESFIHDVEKQIHNQPMYFRELVIFLKHICELEPDKRIAILTDNGFFNKMKTGGFAMAVPQEINEGHNLVFRGIHGARHQRSLDKLGNDVNFVSIVLDRFTSLVAVKQGTPIISSTGYSLFEGIMGLTNSGDIDPGMILYLLKEKEYSVFEIDDILKKQSGFSGFLREPVTAPESLKYLALSDVKVKLAFDIFKNQLLKYMGQSLLALGTLDAIVFSGDFLPSFDSIVMDFLEHISFLGIELKSRSRQKVEARDLWESLSTKASKIDVLANYERLPTLWGKVAEHGIPHLDQYVSNRGLN